MFTRWRTLSTLAITLTILAAVAVGYQIGVAAQATAPKMLRAEDIAFMPNGTDPARGSFVVRVDGKWVPMQLVDPKIDRTIAELQDWVRQE